VFENGVLMRKFGSGRDKLTGGWRKLLNEELHNLFCSLNIIRIMKSRRMRCAGCCSTLEGYEKCTILVGTPVR
jgi:hypothetical protein